MLFFQISVEYQSIFGILKLIKLMARIVTILKLFKLFQEQTLHYETRSILKLSKIFMFMILTGHYCACFWYFIAEYSRANGMQSWIDTVLDNGDNMSAQNYSHFQMYSFSMYWYFTGQGYVAYICVFTYFFYIFETYINVRSD